jgi:uracil-DNA glycosylase family 4
MSFFADDFLPFAGKKDTRTSLELLHTLSCRICPRNHLNIRSPKMEATGSDKPDIYILGESPGRDEDKEGKQFVGKSGSYLREALGQKWIERSRFSNVVQCFHENITPEFVEREACSPRVISDIERTKPKAILGFGATALQFALGEGMISNWRGRRIPIFVGKHKCWFYPLHHPANIIRQIDDKKPWHDMPEDERFFRLDLRRALNDMRSLPKADPHDRERALAGVESVLSYTDDDATFVEMFLDHAGRIESGVDIETPPVRPYMPEACIATVAVSTAEGTISFPIDHPEAKWSPKNKQRVVDAFKRFLKSEGRKAVHSLGFELEYFGVLYGIEYVRAAPWDDTMSQAFVLDQRVSKGSRAAEEGTLECYSLGFLTKVHFGLDIKTLSKVNRTNIMNESLSRVLPYNGMDAKYHRELKIVQDALLESEGLMRVYRDQLRRVPTCTLTQIKGVPLDQEESRRLAIKYDKEIAAISKEIQETATAKLYFQRYGRRLNPSSPQEMITVCRDLLKSDAGLRRNGKYSVDEETLTKIKDPLMPMVLKYRHATKRRSTYVFDDSNPVVWPDGMLHQRLNTCVARTGRLTASDPNCFPGYVEALTMRGWVRWDEVCDDDLLAQFDRDDWSVSFVKPLRMIRAPFIGELISIESGCLGNGHSGHISTIVTPNHNMLVYRKDTSSYLVNASDLGDWVKLPCAGFYAGGSVNMRPSQVTLIAAFQADAYLHKELGFVVWSFKCKRKIARLRNALDLEGISYIERPKAPDQTSFYVARWNLPEWLAQRRHYGSWILDLDRKTLDLFSGEIWHWDGGQNINDFCTGNHEDADWVQIILTLSGCRSRVSQRASVKSASTWFATCSMRPYTSVARLIRTSLSFNGTVYCAQMEKGTVIVRHGGNVLITGNTQNQEKRTKEGRQMRKQIKPKPGHVFLSADYGQIQPRVFAMVSHDRRFMKALWEDYDIHGEWCDRIIKAYPAFLDNYTKEKDPKKAARQDVKSNWVLAQFFGAGIKTVCAKLGLDESVVVPLRERFMKEFEGVFAWQLENLKFYQKHGYVEFLTGRRRCGPLAHGEICNTPIQMGEAEITLDGANRISEMGIWDLQPSILVHDDAVLHIPVNKVDDIVEMLVKEMIRPDVFDFINVPLTVEVSIGDDWCDMHSSKELTYSSSEFYPRSAHRGLKEGEI